MYSMLLIRLCKFVNLHISALVTLLDKWKSIVGVTSLHAAGGGGGGGVWFDIDSYSVDF